MLPLEPILIYLNRPKVVATVKRGSAADLYGTHAPAVARQHTLAHDIAAVVAVVIVIAVIVVVVRIIVVVIAVGSEAPPDKECPSVESTMETATETTVESTACKAGAAEMRAYHASGVRA